MKNNILNDGCWWDLVWDGKKIDGVKKGLTDEELDSFLLNCTKEYKIEGATFYAKSAQDVTRDALTEATNDLHNARIEVVKTSDDGEIEETERYYVIPDSIGVTRAITELNLNEGNPLVTPMDVNDWKSQKIQEYETGVKLTSPDKKVDLQQFKNDSKLTPKQLVDMEEASWTKLTDLGTNVHSIFEFIFKGESPSNPGLPDSVYSSLVGQVNAFKQSIEQKYPGCQFYPEFGIKSKNLSPDVQAILEANNKSSINGIIDLLVIDAKGNAHLYDYKVSRKSIAQDGFTNEEGWDVTGNITIRDNKLWASTKKLSAAYQTELYKQMLKQYGVNVVDTSILPIKLDLEYNNANNPFEVTGVSGVSVQYRNNEIIKNPGMRNGGARSRKISNMFIAPVTTGVDDVDRIGTAWSSFFPKNSIMAKRESMRSSIEYYKQNDRFVHKLKPGETHYGEPKHEYRVRFPGRSISYCSEQDLDNTLQDFINSQHDFQSSKYLSIATALDSVKSGSDISELTKLSKDEHFMQEEFGRYINPDWTMISDTGANSIGINIFRKGNKFEIVILSSDPLRTKQNLGKGTSLFGKTIADKNVDSRKVLPAMTGNMEMMKAMMYISMHSELFENGKIAEIRAVNTDLGIEMSAYNSDLIYAYNELVKQNPGSGMTNVNPSMFMDDRVSVVENAKERVDGLEYLLEDGASGSINYYTAEWFKNKIDLFKSKYGREMDFRNGYKNTPLWNAYQQLNTGYNLARGFKSHTEADVADYITEKSFELNGLMVSSPQYSKSANIRELGQVIDEFAKEVRLQVHTIGAPIQQKIIKLYDKYGTGAKVFDMFFADRERLILKDPDSGEFDGDPVAKDFLNTFLRTLAQLRHPELKTEEDFEKAKSEEDYFAIPLLEAVTSRQIKNLGLFKTLKNKWKENYTTVQGLFMGEEVEGGMAEYVAGNQELYNKFKYDNMAARDARIDQYGSGLFETDLELVINAALEAFCRSNVSRDYIPIVSAMKMNLEYLDAHGSSEKTKDMANIRKRFDDIVKSKLYGESLVPKQLQPLLKFLNLIKSGFTSMTLALNVRSFLRESLQGIFTGLSRAGVKMYPGINEKWYTEGMTYVIQEAGKNFSGVSLLQQLNAVYGMANQSLNQLAQQRRVNWAHINHWGKDTAFITCTSPDFLHRMSLLVAKMKSDGCFDAYSLDENGVLKYDFKKDKRFEHLVKGDTSHSDYLKEKSLYLSMIDDFNRTGFKKVDGSQLNGENLDELPQAYTRTEAQSIKNYADLLYGHYDEESRSLICNTLFGAVFMQYKTYLTAKLEQWTMHEGIYNIATLEQQFDDNGNPLYVKYYEDEDGTPHKDFLLESEYNNLNDEEKTTCRLYYDYSGMPMQGMLQESWNVYKSLLSMDQEKINEIWSDPTTRAMFKLQLHDMWLMALMSLLVTFIFGSAMDVDKPLDPSKVYSAVKKTGPINNLTYNVITGAMADSQLPNIINAFTDRPPVASALSRFATSTMNVITGDASIAGWATRNIGAIRDFQGLADNLKNQ